MKQDVRYPVLGAIETPEDLRRLPAGKLGSLAGELRDFLVRSVADCGGHFAAGLGTVELTVALHYTFNTPEDRLVWDVGHQCYPHKILTGRREAIHTIRQKDGLAGFLRRPESPYDCFGAGHSSTSISAALGMAIVAAQKGYARKAVAIIGDGGLTAGLAYEALNHAGSIDADLLVVLNDNGMSISPNVGALSSSFAKALSGDAYATLCRNGRKILSRLPGLWDFALRAEKHVKGMILPGTFFEELGFRYYGPVDGHDLPTLIKVLKNLRKRKGPRLLHVVTRKGKGYAPAEADPVKYHSVTPFDPKTGQIESRGASGPAYTQVFGDWLCDMAAADRRLVAITPAMREGSGLVKFSRQFPDRYFDVGIAEQHSVTLAAGLACDGLKPVVAIYSTFLQRAYDQVIHDVAIQRLPVLFAIDRAGIVGPDGPTHNGSYDFTFLRCLPGMVIMAPADENECRQMLFTGFTLDGPCAVRYPRGHGPGVPVARDMTALPIGRAEVRRQGRGIALLAFGPMVQTATRAAAEFGATVVNMRFVKPLDRDLIAGLARTHDLLVTIEENAVAGGAGSAINEFLAARGFAIPVINLGLPDRFMEHASREEMLADAGLDVKGVLEAINYHYDAETPNRPPLAVATTGLRSDAGYR